MSKHVIRKGLSSTGSKVHIKVSQGNDYVIQRLAELTAEAIRIAAQADTGTNVFTTNNPDVLHEYKQYDTPQVVSVFSASGEQHEDTLMAEGEGVMKIISDQGRIMR